MVQRKERRVRRCTSLSDEKILRRYRNIEKQMADLEAEADEHKGRIVIYRNTMTEHTRLMAEHDTKQQIFAQLEIQKKTRKFEVPQTDQKKETLKNEYEEIQSKVKEYEDTCRKIEDGRKTVQRLIQEIESLHKEITNSKVKKQQQNMEDGGSISRNSANEK